MLEAYLQKPFQTAREVAMEKRNRLEKKDDFLWLEFLEEVVLSRLSNEQEVVSGRMQFDEVPILREIEWKNPRFEEKFAKLWDDFVSARSDQQAKIKLYRLYLLFKHGGKQFELRQAV